MAQGLPPSRSRNPRRQNGCRLGSGPYRLSSGNEIKERQGSRAVQNQKGERDVRQSGHKAKLPWRQRQPGQRVKNELKYKRQFIDVFPTPERRNQHADQGKGRELQQLLVPDERSQCPTDFLSWTGSQEIESKRARLETTPLPLANNL